MKLFKTLLSILFISLLSPPSWSVTFDNLVHREGIYYEKFTDVPYTGEVTGQEIGTMKNGGKEGFWIRYYENGQLESKGNLKNGHFDGAWVYYYESGRLYGKGNYKDDRKEGKWFHYKSDGTVNKKRTGTYKRSLKISD